MKLIIGLGNPGEKYKNNRHNAGYMFVNKINKSNKSIKAIKTDCFMNDSGKFVKRVMGDLRDLWIAHDDLDLKLGTYKIQFGVGPKIHNGINNIEEVLGTKDFWRIRIGIDNRLLHEKGEDYVLQDFSDNELLILNKVFDAITKDRSFQS